jgi:hypothetical protein
VTDEIESLLPLNCRYWLDPSQGEELKLLITEDLAGEYEEYAKLTIEGSTDELMNQKAAEWVRSHLGESYPAVASGDSDDTIAVELRDGSVINLLGEGISVIDVECETLPDGGTGHVDPSNIEGLVEWFPDEHPGHELA